MAAFIARVKRASTTSSPPPITKTLSRCSSSRGVINALVHDIMVTEATAVRTGRLCRRHPVALVVHSGAGSSWQASTRPSTYGICCRETSSGRQVR